MDEAVRLDILFLLRQCGIIAGLTFVPLVAIACLSPRRRWLLPLSLVCGGAAWVVLFAALFSGMNGIARGPLPYQPFRVGPSAFALWDILKLLSLTLWLPTVVVYGLLRYFVARRHYGIGRSAVVLSFLIYSILGTTWTWLWLRVAEWSHEDTFAAPGFSWAGWTQVREGMSRADVEAQLGQPIPVAFKPAFAREQGAECWVTNLSAGYFAAVWFQNDRVSRKQFWYSD